MSAECETCGKKYSNSSNLRNLHYNKIPEHAPDSWEECPTCGKRYNGLSGHFTNNPSHKPELDKETFNLIKGLVMSDAYVRDRNKDKPRVVLAMTNKKFLEYLSNELTHLTGEVRLKKTAEEVAKDARESGFSEKAAVDDCKDVYEINFTNKEKYKELASWYDNGEKKWPEKLELTPNVLTGLYVGDGSIRKFSGDKYDGARPNLVITTTNEIDNEQKIKSYFTEQGFDAPTITPPQVVFSADTSENLFNYMGEPLPGFEYKWP